MKKKLQHAVELSQQLYAALKNEDLVGAKKLSVARDVAIRALPAVPDGIQEEETDLLANLAQLDRQLEVFTQQLSKNYQAKPNDQTEKNQKKIKTHYQE